jgi:hypothetical protein
MHDAPAATVIVAGEDSGRARRKAGDRDEAAIKTVEEELAAADRAAPKSVRDEIDKLLRRS